MTVILVFWKRRQGNYKLKVIFEYVENSMIKLIFPDISDDLKFFDKVA